MFTMGAGSTPRPRLRRRREATARGEKRRRLGATPENRRRRQRRTNLDEERNGGARVRRRWSSTVVQSRSAAPPARGGDRDSRGRGKKIRDFYIIFICQGKYFQGFFPSLSSLPAPAFGPFWNHHVFLLFLKMLGILF
jgi:hypothetical protein